MGRYLHTMIRVYNLEKSLAFYACLGMKQIRRKDVPEGKYTLVYIGFGSNSQREAEIELTYNWDQTSPYEMGTGFGHLAIGVNDVTETVNSMRKAGGKVTREPGPVQFGTTIIAFVEDPDGYKIELIQIDSFNS
ncbi:Lactoylglutathione lyase [Commensalibacter sp. Nvir]|uniref:lactoylglutathione lyase n=1 Tax=Commensalibacter sp. Nvir TaxID=3069817 RepID=UPI002D6141D2|nr:Lactoylglutathione lyase [Commensalibacter sp. Nvir]